MPLHPHIRSQLSVLGDLSPTASADDFALAMAEFERDPQPWPGSVDAADQQIPGPNGPVDVRVYSADNQQRGLITWIHGGAFMVGDLDMPESDMVASELAARTGATVVAVGYRLARNGVHHPVPVQDCYAAWRWAREQFAPNAPFAALGGASAGASLATGCAVLDRDADLADHADALLLAYPFLHYPIAAPTAELAADLSAELPAALRFTPEFIDLVVGNYVGRIHNLPTSAMPGQADLRDLPPTHVVVAEYDDLRPSGETFCRQLRDAGVPATLRVAPGMPHGYLNRSLFLDEVGRSIDFLASAVNPQPAADPAKESAIR
jgi:acetyl esterase/lipase